MRLLRANTDGYIVKENPTIKDILIHTVMCILALGYGLWDLFTTPIIWAFKKMVGWFM